MSDKIPSLIVTPTWNVERIYILILSQNIVIVLCRHQILQEIHFLFVESDLIISMGSPTVSRDLIWRVKFGSTISSSLPKASVKAGERSAGPMKWWVKTKIVYLKQIKINYQCYCTEFKSYLWLASARDFVRMEFVSHVNPVFLPLGKEFRKILS